MQTARTLHKILLNTCEANAHRCAFIYRIGDRDVEVSYRKFRDDVLLLAHAFTKRKIRKGTKVLLLSDNRYGWIVTDFALTAVGAISVPRGSDTPSRELEYILEHSDSEVLIVETASLLTKHEELLKRLRLKHIFIIEGEKEHRLFSNLYSYNELLGEREISEQDIAEFEALEEQLSPEDVYTLIYTSGTTGNPKGVMLTHHNLDANLIAIPQVVPLDCHDVWLSVLPTWHIFERAAEYVALDSGACIVYSSVKTFAADLERYQPTLVCSVPRLWEALYVRINAALESQGKHKARLFKLLVAISASFRRNRRALRGHLPRFGRLNLAKETLTRLWALLKLPLLFLPYLLAQKKFVLVRKKFGGRLKLAVSGGGSLPQYLDEWIDAFDIRIVNAYGMTECAPAIAGRGSACKVFGTLGPPFPGIELRIADEHGRTVKPGVEGEIEVRGPQVMPGYYRDDEENAKVFTPDGFLRTGDLGRITRSGELVITGRSKEIIVLASGENVDPSRIEGAISALPFVKDAVLVGQDRKGLGALIVPDMEQLSAFARERLIQIKPGNGELLSDQSLLDRARQEINRLLHPKRGFKQHERLHGIQFLDREFTPGEELTNTLKKKRHVIERKYRELIDRLFH
ncbi:MAG: long-chain fatty acid--CoA ligase [Desulfuromonas sp.]|nr:MAG: long-chain fatty acid--CoA ligase [Desulfuromonas sp.]